MYYHPIIGITIFFASILLAFYIGKNIKIKKKFNKNNFIVFSNNKESLSMKKQSISPDANWIE
tara:strand:+ start:299 stop:487 length:189 start_codon:yes stop_codon:yes gene_type:complete